MVTLLIVDPDESLAGTLAAALKPHGMGCVHAATGERALEILGEVRVALVITELNLPGMSGFDFIHFAHNHDPFLGVVVFTSVEDMKASVHALRLGVREYLVKHIDSQDYVVRGVQRALEGTQLDRDRSDLLGRVADLHDEFLRTLVHIERENVALQEQLGPDFEIPVGTTRLLIVDDDEVICTALAEVLGSEGYQVQVCTSLDEASERIEHNRYHVVLADKNLGDRSGIDLLKKIKTRSPGTDVLLMTGDASVESAVAAVNFGASGYLVKPIEDLDEVTEKIAELRRKQDVRRRASHFLQRFKARNRAFVEKYEDIRRRLRELIPRERKSRAIRLVGNKPIVRRVAAGHGSES